MDQCCLQRRSRPYLSRNQCTVHCRSREVKQVWTARVEQRAWCDICTLTSTAKVHKTTFCVTDPHPARKRFRYTIRLSISTPSLVLCRRSSPRHCSLQSSLLDPSGSCRKMLVMHCRAASSYLVLGTSMQIKGLHDCMNSDIVFSCSCTSVAIFPPNL